MNIIKSCWSRKRFRKSWQVCTIDILDYVNEIGNGCIFAQSTPPLLVGMETSLLTTPVSFQRRSPT